MFYNTRSNTIVSQIPLDGYYENGTLVQGLNLLGPDIHKLCGFLPIKSDSPEQPANSYEDIAQRNVLIEDDGVVVTRVYLPNPIIVPSTISARQVRLWLIDNDISLTSVEAAIDTIVNEKIREKTRVEWEYAPYIERNHPLIESLAQYLGLNPSQIDQAFIEASEL